MSGAGILQSCGGAVMTDKEQFAAELVKLAEVFKVELTKPMVEAYWESVKIYDQSLVRKAVPALVVGEWFPKPYQWVTEIHRLERDRKPAPRLGTGVSAGSRTLVFPDGQELQIQLVPELVQCGACEDRGWEILPCNGVSGACGRTRPHAPHESARNCTCHAPRNYGAVVVGA